MASLVWALVLFAGLACSASNADTLGKPTSIEEFPSLVQVEFRVQLSWIQQCSGAVLTSYHIMSAASCFSGDFFDMEYRRVRAGTSYRGVEGQVRGISEVYVHPTFGTLGKEGDIAVVRLEGYLTLGSTIQQVSILGEGIELPIGLHLLLASWGTTTEGGAEGDKNLYSLDLYNINFDTCLTQYYGQETITENMVCAGLRDTNGRDVDVRDYGAPIFYSGVAVGLVSFGVADGEDAYPVVTTAIGSYTNWIVGTAV